MRILLLVHGFNALSQRLHVELREAGHEVTVEFDVSERLDSRSGSACCTRSDPRALSEAQNPGQQFGGSIFAWWSTLALPATLAQPRSIGRSWTARANGA
jgi:hypothetical protein